MLFALKISLIQQIEQTILTLRSVQILKKKKKVFPPDHMQLY